MELTTIDIPIAMSKEAIHLSSAEGAETLAIIREECSAAPSSVEFDEPQTEEEEYYGKSCTGDCLKNKEIIVDHTDDIETLLNAKEKQFKQQLDREINLLKQRCEFILQNEQIRASYMLREAHRERQEKISALQTQLECKNLAGLMFVMCNERRKSKLEKLKIIEEYTGYINSLHDILNEAQLLILNLSRGYKTAARVDTEWREKMTNVLKEFQCFIHDFVKGTPESEQYLFDVPALLSTKAPIIDDPQEDPCDCDSLLLGKQTENLRQDNAWYDNLDESCRPFVLFGDMETFEPNERRVVLRKLKEAKVAPRKWKEYVFNEMQLKAECNNADIIKDSYQTRLPIDKWECAQGQPDYYGSNASRRTTAASIDVRGNMGSMLKIITQNTTHQPRATLLGARDSMEIASTTKLKEKHRQTERSRVVIKLDKEPITTDDTESDESPILEPLQEPQIPEKDDDEVVVEGSLSALGSIHNDSLHVIGSHVPDKDHNINYEKICPMEQCQRMQVDSFIRTLPPYMRANPFTHFEQTYEEYEPCTPEQLEILKQRIEAKTTKNKREVIEDPLTEWTPSVQGVAVQTSQMSLPPCTCIAPSPTPVSSCNGMVFDLKDLIPVKQTLNRINQECFYDHRIEFNRFQLIGEENETPKGAKKKDRLQEITKILKLHPSFLDIFQANTV